MPVYLWEGKNKKNEKQKGEMEVGSEDAVRASLNRMKIRPTKIKEKPADLLANIAFLQPSVKQADIIIFAKQFSTMIDAGLPIIQCLDILHTQQENPTFKKMLHDIKSSVEAGATFAETLKKYPDQFDDLFVNMIAAGEIGGILDTILRRLSDFMEKAAKLKARVKGAMTYPAITLVVAFVVVAVILVFVIPVFQKMFADFGGELPAPTKFVVMLSEVVKSKILFIIGGIVAFGFAFKKYYGTEKGRYTVDKISLKLPIFGDLIRKTAVAKFT
ncbi:type II secretion system F family protein, partial [Thermodesulfobacteriota bacterium]